MVSPIRVLQVEDNPGDYVLVREMLVADDPNAVVKEFELVRVETFADALKQVSDERFDCVLLDLSLPDAKGVETFYTFRALAPYIPVIIVSGLDDERAALSSVQSGAQDYLLKGELTASLLRRTVRYAVERFRIMREFDVVREEAVWANKAKSEFLIHVGTELRQKFASLRAEIDRILVSAEPSPQTDAIASVGEGIGTSDMTMGHAVDFARIELGEMILNEEVFNIRNLLLRIERNLEYRFRDVPIYASCSDDVPEYIAGDPVRLEQLITFLASFLDKNCRRGGDYTLHFSRRNTERRQLCLEISLARANGQLSADKQQTVFESFAQADTTILRKYGSEGLGFAVCARIAALCDGKIWLVSSPESPTTFHFTGFFKEAEPGKVRPIR